MRHIEVFQWVNEGRSLKDLPSLRSPDIHVQPALGKAAFDFQTWIQPYIVQRTSVDQIDALSLGPCRLQLDMKVLTQDSRLCRFLFIY